MKTIKVKETKMHSYTFKENEGTNYYRVGGNTVPVAEAKLVLIKDAENALLAFNQHNGEYYIILNKGDRLKMPASYLIPILISETEKIEKGDITYHPQLGELSKMELNDSIEAHKLGWLKVLALSEHFSPKLLQDIVDGKLKEGDRVLVECMKEEPILMTYTGIDTRGDYLYYCPKCKHGGSFMGTGQVHCYKDNCRNSSIKLNSLSHITLHKLEEKKYSREEVLNVLKKFALYVDTDKVEYPSIYRQIVGEWFNTNVT